MIYAVRSDTMRMLDTLEQKLALEITELTKLDLRDVGLEIVDECARIINAPKIESKVADFEVIDFVALEKASTLLHRDDVTSLSVAMPSREVKALSELEKFDEHVRIMKKQWGNLPRLEVGLRIGMALDAHLRNILMCLDGEQVPIPELISLVESKLRGASRDELALTWGRLKAEFQPPQFANDGSLRVLPPILDDSFFVVRNAEDLPRRIAEFVIRIRPQLMRRLWAEGEKSFPLILPGPATFLAHKTKRLHETPTTLEMATLRCISTLLWIWENVLGGDKKHFLAVVGLNENSRAAKGDDYQKVDNVLKPKKGSKNELLKLFVLELRQLGTFAERYVSTASPVERALMHFKLGREVMGAERNEWSLKNEIRLQREMCKFLLEQGVYSFGKSFGRNEIDLMAEQSGEVFVVEAKRVKKVTPSLVKKFIPQLQTYLDQEPSASRGILAIFNYGSTLVTGPRVWLHGRYWILAINLGARSASKTRSSLQIVEGKDGQLVDCLVIDGEPAKRSKPRRTKKGRASR